MFEQSIKNKAIASKSKNMELIRTIFGIVPAINSLWIKIIKYLGGSIEVKYWKILGIELIG